MISPIVTVPLVIPVSLLPFAALGWDGEQLLPGCETTPFLGFVGWVVVPPVFDPPVLVPPVLVPPVLVPPVFPPPSLPPAGAEAEVVGPGVEDALAPGTAT